MADILKLGLYSFFQLFAAKKIMAKNRAENTGIINGVFGKTPIKSLKKWIIGLPKRIITIAKA